MIRELFIRNLAIITELALPLESGMTALTGETGAGKSILVDALGLVLGDRGDASLIQEGRERAEISAIFDIRTDTRLCAWLRARDLDQGEECVLRRILSRREGRSRAYINGRPVTIQMLRELGRFLVEIYGQHAHQSLLRPAVQRALLDIYGGHTHLGEALQAAYQHWQQRNQELERLRQKTREQTARLELLRYQVEELEAFRPESGELEQLEQEQQQLVHAAELVQGADAAVDLLYQNEHGAVYALLGQLGRQLEHLQAIDPKLRGAVELVEAAAVQVEEAAGELRHYLGSLEFDSERLQWIEERLSGFYELARKHRAAASELPALRGQLLAELTELETLGTRLDALQQESAAALEKCRRCATRLSQARAKAALALARKVTESMQLLAMPGGCFKVALIPLRGREFSPHGAEQVEFQVSTNPGHSPGPLSKIASGGELSRIGLAIQMLASQWEGIATQVFDEVDVGIGGAVAETVGARLRALGAHRQVLCVTHLPQVAAQAHSQIRLSKYAHAQGGMVELTVLNDRERVEEIARMVGGKDITEHSRAHAQEMLEKARWGKEAGFPN